jgi:hypothetical protein
MKKLAIVSTLFPLFVLLFSACGSDKKADEQTSETTQQTGEEGSTETTDLTSTIKEAQEALSQLQSGQNGEVVDFRELKELLPENLAGMKRNSHTGEKVGAAGFNMSNARATYMGGGKNLDISLVDVGGFGAAIAGMAAWSNLEIDRESDEEIERTYTKDGYKAFEKYNFKEKRGELNLLLNNRFILNISGRNIERKELEEVLAELNLNRLGNLK